MRSADILTTVESCSASFIVSLGDTVISVFCVTNDVALIGWNILADVVDSAELHAESVCADWFVHPENTDPETDEKLIAN